MSQTFSIAGWLLTLYRAESCIDGDGRGGYEDSDYGDEFEPRYYALAQDWKGSHCPYPKLPLVLRRVFRNRIKLSYWMKASLTSIADWFAKGDRTRYRKDGDLRRFAMVLNWIYARHFHVYHRGRNWSFGCSKCGACSFVSLRGRRCTACGHRHANSPRYVRWWHRYSLLRFLEWCGYVERFWWWRMREMDGYSAWKVHDRGPWILRYHRRITFRQMLQEIGWNYRMFGLIGMDSRLIKIAADHELERIKQRILDEDEVPF